MITFGLLTRVFPEPIFAGSAINQVVTGPGFSTIDQPWVPRAPRILRVGSLPSALASAAGSRPDTTGRTAPAQERR